MAGRTRWKIYLRRSIVRRARDTVSIDKQRHFAEQWLEENRIPADQVDWFVDAQGHRSARWETTRPEWMRVKAELLLPSTAGLWCFEMDRTHRNVRATAELVETAQNTGLRLVSYKDNIDTANGLNSDDLVVIMLKAALAQRESSKASERMTDAIHERVRDLGPWGTPPFGATYTGEGKTMRQIINPPHDATMREMCRIYAAGASYGETGDEMNRLGLLNLSRGKAMVPWNRETVRSALHNVLSLNGWRTPLKFNKDAKIQLGEGQGSAIEKYAESVKAERSPFQQPFCWRKSAAKCVVGRRHLGEELQHGQTRSVSSQCLALLPADTRRHGGELPAAALGSTSTRQNPCPYSPQIHQAHQFEAEAKHPTTVVRLAQTVHQAVRQLPWR